MPLRGSKDIEDAQVVIDAFVGELMRLLPDYVPN
jgi:hypothetical protein